MSRSNKRTNRGMSFENGSPREKVSQEEAKQSVQDFLRGEDPPAEKFDPEATVPLGTMSPIPPAASSVENAMTGNGGKTPFGTGTPAPDKTETTPAKGSHGGGNPRPPPTPKESNMNGNGEEKASGGGGWWKQVLLGGLFVLLAGIIVLLFLDRQKQEVVTAQEEASAQAAEKRADILAREKVEREEEAEANRPKAKRGASAQQARQARDEAKELKRMARELDSLKAAQAAEREAGVLARERAKREREALQEAEANRQAEAQEALRQRDAEVQARAEALAAQNAEAAKIVAAKKMCSDLGMQYSRVDGAQKVFCVKKSGGGGSSWSRAGKIATVAVIGAVSGYLVAGPEGAWKGARVGTVLAAVCEGVVAPETNLGSYGGCGVGGGALGGLGVKALTPRKSHKKPPVAAQGEPVGGTPVGGTPASGIPLGEVIPLQTSPPPIVFSDPILGGPVGGLPIP